MEGRGGGRDAPGGRGGKRWEERSEGRVHPVEDGVGRARVAEAAGAPYGDSRCFQIGDDTCAERCSLPWEWWFPCWPAGRPSRRGRRTRNPSRIQGSGKPRSWCRRSRQGPRLPSPSRTREYPHPLANDGTSLATAAPMRRGRGLEGRSPAEPHCDGDSRERLAHSGARRCGDVHPNTLTEREPLVRRCLPCAGHCCWRWGWGASGGHPREREWTRRSTWHGGSGRSTRSGRRRGRWR